MPKERIPARSAAKYHTQTNGVTTTLTSSGTNAVTSSTTATNIAWHPTSPVTYPYQVVVQWGNQHPSVTIATIDTSEDLDQFSLESGLFVELSRSEVNQLITTLRRARDKAFGKDA